jgi:hypothetical protein
MLPMKYWEIIADKRSAGRLVLAAVPWKLINVQ